MISVLQSWTQRPQPLRVEPYSAVQSQHEAPLTLPAALPDPAAGKRQQALADYNKACRPYLADRDRIARMVIQEFKESHGTDFAHTPAGQMEMARRVKVQFTLLMAIRGVCLSEEAVSEPDAAVKPETFAPR